MTATQDRSPEDLLIEQRLLRLNELAISLGVGLLAGLALVVGTLWLVWQGGPWTGQHLGLLSQYFPGYSVTVGGAIVGFFYAFVSGGIAGYVLVAVYNRLAR